MQPLPPPRFGSRLAPSLMLPRISSSVNTLFNGPVRPRLPPPQYGMSQPNGPPPFFLRPKSRDTALPMVPCGIGVPNAPIMRHWHRRGPQIMPSVRSRFTPDKRNFKGKVINNTKKAHLHPDNEGLHNRRNGIDGFEDDTSYYCGVCDRDFPSNDALIEHKSTHRLCGIDGCTFSAHPLLIEKHISIQHSTGLYARMKDLSEEEGAKKWAEERKKRFPTKSNIKLREAEDLEKLQRGETIKQDQYVTKTTRMTSTYGKKRKPHRRLTRETVDCSYVDEIYRGVRPFPGRKVLQQENTSEVCLNEETNDMEYIFNSDSGAVETDEKRKIDNIPQALVESKPTNLCASLVANYGSEEEDDFPEEVPIKRIKIEDLPPKGHKIAENITVGKETSNDMQSCTNVSEDTSSHQPIINEISQHPVTKRQNKQKHKTNQIVEDKKHEKVSTRHHNKLLQMLLSRSIQYERNLISQCLKYIVDNNFFESFGV